MKLSGFRQSWSQAARENTVKNVLIAALVATNALTVIGWFRTAETIVLVPPMQDKRLAISESNASPEYKKAWALMVAQLAGNITPGNADLVLRSLGDFLSPDAYHNIAANLASQIGDIKRDSLTVSFEPRQVLFEPSTNKVFVTGQFASQGVSGTPIKAIRTYEMKVDVRFGRAWITTFKPYVGMPVTEDAQQRAAATSESREQGGRT
jgi:conjugal transfer pilus assembly protein TraE